MYPGDPPRPFSPPTSQQAPPAKGSGGALGITIILAALGCLGLVAVVAIGAIVVLVMRQSGSEIGQLGPEPQPAYYPDPTVPSVGPQGVGAAVGAGEVERVRVSIAAHNPTRGPADAPVTIVEFSDFQCPFCVRATSTMSDLLAQYPGQLRLVWKNNPLAFHQNARPAAMAAMEARAQRGDEGFWLMHDRLFANARALSRQDLERYAGEQGLDAGAFRRSLDSSAHETAIAADQAMASEVGATGTPTFFINGRLLTGAQPIDSFRPIIDEELRNSNALMARGVPRARIYDEIMRTASARIAPTVRSIPPPDTDGATVQRVLVGDSPQQGRADALVTVVVFSDFECPFCSRVVPTLTRLRERYGPDLRVVFKHYPLPFHQRATPASEAAVEVYRQRGAAAFWRMHDMLFENQRSLEDEDLVGYAQRCGANAVAVRQALQSGRHRATVDQDVSLAREVGVRGTPAFFINGHLLSGAQPYERFAEVVDRELASARALLAAGTPRERVYDTIIGSAPL